jgi:hypothetical protein
MLENIKTHAESREFRPHGSGLQFEADLFFKEDSVNTELAPYPFTWNVEQGNRNAQLSFSSRIFSRILGRVRGLDHQSPRTTFLYCKETESPAFWHENQISFDANGVMQNKHEPLPDWPETFPGPNAFARKVAARWNIETWREGEESSLFNLDEVSP